MRYLRTEFPDKGWTTSSVNRLLKKFRDTDTVDRRQGSTIASRSRNARTDENINQVNDDMVLSQQGQPRPHSTVREMLRKTGIPKSAVVRIIRKDLQLKCFKRQRAQKLTGELHVLLVSTSEEVSPVCRGLHILYRWKGAHCGFSSERIVKLIYSTG